MRLNFFAKNLKYVCSKKGVDADMLANITGKKPQSINNYKRGKTEPSATVIIKMCNFLEVSPNFMLLIDIEANGGLNILKSEASFVPFGKNLLNEELSEYRMQPFAAGSVPPTSSAFLGDSSDLGPYRERLADKEQIIRLLTAENERLKKECETLKKQIDKK